MKKNIAFNPLDLPMYVMAKPAGATCNLRCAYCYYLEKEEFYKNRKSLKMSDELLEKFTKEYIEMQPAGEVLFTWHGGEALLRDIDFYKKALRFQQRYARGRKITNTLQTNGTLLNDEWCKFFHDNEFLIGISIDGPEHCHDFYRKNADEIGSFAKTMRGIELLKKHAVEFNTLSVINDYNVNFPEEIYDFLKSIGSKFLQFSPIVERISTDETVNLASPEEKNAPFAKWTVESEKFGEFYTRIFDKWILADVGEVFVQLFDATLACLVGVSPGVCLFAERCGHAAALEFNGDVYACDHYVFPEFKLGNIYTTPLLTMMLSEKQNRFGDKKLDLPKTCLQCEFRQLCNGECPKNRILENGENYLCKGYKKYFKHVEPYMNFMAQELRFQRPPANVMQWAKSLKNLV